MSRPSPSSPTLSRGLRLKLAAALALALPFLALMWVNSYARVEPKLGPWPFFFWFQIVWVVITALLTYLAFLLVEGAQRGSESSASGTSATEADDE